MKTITPIELKKRIDNNNNFVLLDVRETHEVAFAQINPHTNIPTGSIPVRHQELDKNTPIIVMCHGGVRSTQVCRYLEPLGYDVTNLEGGIDAWSQRVDPNLPRY
jgi:rhodanese-related sulfurtransferase